MSVVTSIRRIVKRFRKAPVPSHGESIVIAGNVLTFVSTGNLPVSFLAQDVVAIWYDYNPFGWQHANSLRFVYGFKGTQASIDVYDQQHTFEPLMSWLQQHFPATVSVRYRELWSAPGGDDPSIKIWAANGSAPNPSIERTRPGKPGRVLSSQTLGCIHGDREC